MRAIVTMAAALMFAAGAASAQAQAPAPAPILVTPAINLFASSADVQALIANARKMHKPGRPVEIQTIVSLAPYAAHLEYRTAVAQAAVHEKEAEIFYVIEGSGNLVTGGKLIDEKRTNPENLVGSAIAGGGSRPVAKGDFIIVPQGTPHWFDAIGGELLLMSLHVPRG